jgi:hypothetical protein
VRWKKFLKAGQVTMGGSPIFYFRRLRIFFQGIDL